MKFLAFFLLAFLVISCSSTEKIPTQRTYFDGEGKETSEEEFMQVWRDKNRELARWDHIENGRRNISLSSPLYTRLQIDYIPLLRNLEKITGQQYDENSVLLIEYEYKDDLCSSSSSNTWNKTRIRKRKSFLKPVRNAVLEGSENMVYLCLFQEGIALRNNPDSDTEYFFQDKKNFLRNTIFKDPTLCGSFALIKPNGQTLVKNGEDRADWVAAFLQPEYWNAIFPSEN